MSQWRRTPAAAFDRPLPSPLPVRRRASASPPPLLLLFVTVTSALSAAVRGVAGSTDAAPSAAAPTCSSFARYYASLGYNPLEVPRSAAGSGDALAVCPSSISRCCTLKSESNLVLSSKKWLKNGISPAMHTARTHLHKLTVDMDAFFALLLERAHKELHDMFVRAYSVKYLQNADVFNRLFTRFRGYYGGSDEDLALTVRGFFAEIFSRMYKMINAGDRSVTPAYLESCVGGQLEQLAPFGEMPAQLGLGVRRALVVARTFMQGLSVGHHAFLAVLNWVQNPGTQCLHTVTRMLHCPSCAADTAIANISDLTAAAVQRTPPLMVSPAGRQLACHAGCAAAVRSCFSPEFVDGWDKYTTAMDAVGVRLEDEGAFNIEAVLGPLKDSISAAIMDYNSNHLEIEKKIITIPGCQKVSGGQLRPFDADSRGKRDTPAYRRGPAESWRAAGSARSPPGVERGATSEQTLRRLVSDVRMHLRRLRSVWKTLENQFCIPAMGVAPTSNDSCIGAASENLSVTAAGSSSQQGSSSRGGLNSSELSLDSATAPGAGNADELLVANATRLLRIVTVHLNEAVAEQRNITWLRLPSASERVASGSPDVDDDDEGSAGASRRQQGGGAATGGSSRARSSGYGSDGDDDDDDGSGSGAAGNQHNFRRSTRPPRPGGSFDDDDDDSDDRGSGLSNVGATRTLPPIKSADGERPPPVLPWTAQPPKHQSKTRGSGSPRSASASTGVLLLLLLLTPLTCSAALLRRTV